MRIINRGRGTGKTSMLVSTAYMTGMPIITSTNVHKRAILDTARKMNIQDNIDIFTIEEWQVLVHHNKKVLIDDVDIMLGQILSRYLKADVVAGTMTIPMDNKEELAEQKNVEEKYNSDDLKDAYQKGRVDAIDAFFLKAVDAYYDDNLNASELCHIERQLKDQK